MAHACPECGADCFCNGDIDDCRFDDPYFVNRCACCPFEGYEDDDDGFDDELEIGGGE